MSGEPEGRLAAGDGDRALVLTGGGARGAYQVGVLSALAERCGDDLQFPVITGVSAGAINATSLASHRRGLPTCAPSLEEAWLGLTTEHVFEVGFAKLSWNFMRWLVMLVSGGTAPQPRVRGLLDTQPLRRYLSTRLELEGIGANVDAGRLQALALSATSYHTGQTCTFIDGAPDVTLWERAGRQAVRAEMGLDHVMASSALPLIFPAVRVGDYYFGDGSVRQGAPLAPAIHLGASRILAVSVRYARSVAEAAERQVEGYPPPAQVLSMLMNSVFLDALEADAERLRRINRTLALLPDRTVHPDGLRPVELLLVRPSRDLGKLSANLEMHLPRTLRILVRGLGAQESSSPDFLSYLLFERPYVERLIDLGREDTFAQWDRVAPFIQC